MDNRNERAIEILEKLDDLRDRAKAIRQVKRPERVKIDVEKKSSPPRKSLVTRKGGPGSILIDKYKSWGVTGCRKCDRLARRMNKWGVTECREPENYKFIVDDLMKRATIWWRKESIWVKTKVFWQGNESFLDRLSIASKLSWTDASDAIRKQLEIHVNMALNEAEALGYN